MKGLCTLMGIASALSLAQPAEWISPHSLEAEESAPVALLPFPREVKWISGSLPLGKRADWKGEGVTDGILRTAWEGFLSDLEVGESGRSVICRLVRDGAAVPGDAQAEGYVLRVDTRGVEIRAGCEEGLYNGLQTLRQLAAGREREIPFCEITDWPAFAVRGFHHDCGRNFQSVESLKRQLDLASRLKLNYFHWHLTDEPAWHVQCKAYPQLNDPAHRTRDLHDTYTYEQIRDLFRFARARHITIIPELDMPGHSDYFDRAFGFPMHSEQGMRVLEEIIEEFCAEVPAELCPILHFGADEVDVPNAREFVERISRKIEALGRVPMQWEGPWDLPLGSRCIAQRWVQSRNSQDAATIKSPTIDSSIGYSNLFEPPLLVRRWFFMRPCGAEKGDAEHLGAIYCTWPDIRVEDKSRIPLHNPMWPGLCAMAERAWNGAAAEGAPYAICIPPDKNSTAENRNEAARAFRLFERRMMALRRGMFRDEHFPYWPEDGGLWEVTQPVPDAQADAVREAVMAGKMPGNTRCVSGYSLYFHTRAATWNLGMYHESKPGVRVWARTNIRVAEEGDYPFMIGFDAPTRSNRQYTGIPHAGEWSQCGTRIWVNGEELRNPRRYDRAGEDRVSLPTWHTAENEKPIRDDDLWWAQPPTFIHLRQGENAIIIEQPYTDDFQSWEINFIPCAGS